MSCVFAVFYCVVFSLISIVLFLCMCFVCVYGGWLFSVFVVPVCFNVCFSFVVLFSFCFVSFSSFVLRPWSFVFVCCVLVLALPIGFIFSTFAMHCWTGNVHRKNLE